MKANAMTEGKRSDFFNHLKAASDSLSALAWIAFTGKDCGKHSHFVGFFFLIYSVILILSFSAFYDVTLQGMSMPIAHVEESWQMAEFYNNKVLIFNLVMLSYVNTKS